MSSDPEIARPRCQISNSASSQPPSRLAVPGGFTLVATIRPFGPGEPTLVATIVPFGPGEPTLVATIVPFDPGEATLVVTIRGIRLAPRRRRWVSGRETRVCACP